MRLPFASAITGALIAGAAFLPGYGFAAGPPIQLASAPFTPFTGRSLVVGDFDGANGPDLAGVNGSNVVIALRQPGGTFAAETPIAMGVTTESLRSADLDGDGRPDLVCAASSARALATRLNLGGGAFAAPLAIPTGGNARSLALGDLNGDGRPDAVTALFDSAEIAVCLNDGAGNLQPPFRLAVAAGTAYVEIGDFTGDGKNDVVGVTFGCPAPGCVIVTVFPGRSDGTFDAPLVSTWSNIEYRISIASGDLDDDGDLDLVFITSSKLVWLANQGDGTFGAPVTFGPSGNYFQTEGQIAVGNVDGDGHRDVIVAAYLRGTEQEKNYALVLRGHGDGTFDPPAEWHVGQFPRDAAVADFDGDGRTDVVVTSTSSAECCGFAGSASAWVLRNTGFGTFDAQLDVPMKAYMPVRRSDGPADLLGTTAANRLTRARNRGHGTFLPLEDLGRGTPWRAADLDGDGNDEILVTSGDSLWALRALAPGVYGPPSSVRSGVFPRDLADFDGDGKLDLLAIDASLHVFVLPGDGAGGLGLPIDYAFTMPSTPHANSIRGGDADGDGRADLLFLPRSPEVVVPNSFSTYREWLHVVRNDGAQHFAPVDSFAIQYDSSIGSGTFGDLALGDFDGDHVMDAYMTAISCTNDQTRFWGGWRGLGGGAFASLGNATSSGNSPCALVARDMNGDGLDDLVRTNSNGGLTFRVSTFTASGGGAFTPSALGNMGYDPGDLFLADMDGDGHPDVVTRSVRDSTSSIRRNVTIYDSPTATLLSLVSIEVVDGAAVLDWFAAGEAPTAATIERRTDTSGWSLLAPLAPAGDGHLRYVDRALPSAARAGYRVRWSDADGAHVTAEAWLDLPSTDFALRGVWPNPSGSTPAFAIVLPRAGAIDLDLYDLAGRRLAHEHRTGLAAGPQRVSPSSVVLAPGIYLARVSFGSRRQESRFVVLR